MTLTTFFPGNLQGCHRALVYRYSGRHRNALATAVKLATTHDPVIYRYAACFVMKM